MFDEMSRRDFIKAAGVGAVATATGGISRANAESKPEQKKWQMKLSTSTIHYRELPFDGACEKISGLGFEGIDIWSTGVDQGYRHLDNINDRLGPEGLKAILKKHNLKLFSFTTWGGYERYAELLGKVGGGVAVRGSVRSEPIKPQELKSKMKQFLEGLKPQAELTEKHNSYLAIENHGGALLTTLDSFKAFVDLNKSKRIGIALAPYHVQREKQSVTEAIKICGKQLLFFYAWQNQPKLKQLPGVGTTDFTPWLKALAKIRYRGYVNPFAHIHPGTNIMTANLAKSKDYLEQCYKKINPES
jgi:sugar phosphate isomerase/epimerase